MRRKWSLLAFANAVLIVVFYLLGQALHNWLSVTLPMYSEFFLNSNESYLQSAAGTFSKLFMFAGFIIALIVSFFLSSAQFNMKLLGRLFRSGCLATLIFVLAFIALLASAFLISLVVNVNLFEFIGEMFFSSSTELIGALITFLLLDTFARTWEEGEEAKDEEIRELKKVITEQAEKQEKIIQALVDTKFDELKAAITELSEKQEQVPTTLLEDELKSKLKVLMAEWEEKIKIPEIPNHPKNARLKPVQKGRIEAYQQAINDIQALIN